jgi:tetratricopeptide (TPR) repeat protein
MNSSDPTLLERLVEELATLPDEAAVRAFVASRNELRDVEVVEALCDRVGALVFVELDRAERLAEAARLLAEGLGDDYSRARCLRATAHVLFSRGRHAVAVEHYEAAATVFRSLGREIEVGRTLSSSLQPLLYLGRYADAQERAEEAREIFTRAGDHLRLARLDSNFGNLLHRQDRFAEALPYYRRALEAFSASGAERDAAVALTNIAACQVSLHQLGEAIDTYTAARAFCEEHGMPLLALASDYNVAYLYFQRGQYTRAMALYEDVRARSEAVGDAHRRALCDLDLAELSLELNLLREGTSLAERAFSGFSALAMGYEAAKALALLGLAACREGQSVKGLELLERARGMFEAEGNAIWPALLDVWRALVLEGEGRASDAAPLCLAALEAFEAAGLRSRVALCRIVLARALLRLQRLAEARRTCLAAIEQARELELPHLHCQALALLGGIEEALGASAAAAEAYRGAHATLEDLRSQLQRDDVRIGFLKDKLGIFESLVWMHLAERKTPADVEAAFALVEQAKSRSLAEAISRGTEAPRPAREGGATERVRALRQELNWCYRAIDQEEVRAGSSRGALEALRQRSRELEAELLRSLREAPLPERAALPGEGAVELEAIRGALPEDTMVVEYYETRGTILAFLLSREGVEAVPVALASRVRHLLRLLRFQLSRFRLGSRYVRRHARGLEEATYAHLRELHDELLAPLRERLSRPRLVVVPHGALHYVPFHALHDGEGYLIDQRVVSYAPSASVYHLCRARGESPGSGALVLGVPDEDTAHIIEEVQAVAAALPGARMLLGSEATETVLRQWGPRSRVLHIATHGLFRHDNPLFSSVHLAGSRLSLFDLYGLDLPARLVTLSGCGTALHVVEGGDELVGLARGLLFAGARAALVTLWDVNDLSTAEFMTRFYRHLSDGRDLASAVQAAMRDLRRSHPHPYHWAPFVLTGWAESGTALAD